jgi:hypothetical protein
MLLSKYKSLQKVLPLNQIKFLSQLDKEGELEYEPILDRLDKEIENIPSKAIENDLAIIAAHYFLHGSDWYVLEYHPKNNEFFGFVVLQGDYQNAELGYFSFSELDQFNKWPNLINLDFYWTPKTLSKLKVQLGIIDASNEIIPDTKNQLIADTYFKENPSKILGTEVQKKRGDRGEDKFETIVKGSLEDALLLIDVPIVHPFVISVDNVNDATEDEIVAKAKVKVLALALELEFDLED